MTEATSETPPPPEVDKSKIIIPTEEEEQLDVKELILKILGYACLLFAGLSLIFPFWNWLDTTPTYHFISYWQLSIDGTPYFHWDIIYNFFLDWPTNMNLFRYVIFSGICISASITFIILIVKDVWKRTFPGIAFFIISIIFGAIFGVIFPIIIGFPFSGPFTSLYGSTWGFAFGWWTLFLAGILGVIRKSYSDKIKREKEEETK
ncbi:MAG: hypothetical protein HWN65_08250 [Candidatus Helarchaeota archaeon]|nr:hypothetical protein [Candidatus Helarchaeota archaeon]